MAISLDKKFREMRRFSEQHGNLLDQTLYDLCKRHPNHTDIGEIAAKLWLIGRGFATGVERQIRCGWQMNGPRDRSNSIRFSF